MDLQLQATFGCMLPVKIKLLVNRELDAGIWVDGYETAVTPKDLSVNESTELMEVILSFNPDAKIDLETLSLVVDKVLPQSTFAKLVWLVAEDASFVMSDSLRVARF